MPRAAVEDSELQTCTYLIIDLKIALTTREALIPIEGIHPLSFISQRRWTKRSINIMTGFPLKTSMAPGFSFGAFLKSNLLTDRVFYTNYFTLKKIR